MRTDFRGQRYKQKRNLLVCLIRLVKLSEKIDRKGQKSPFSLMVQIGGQQRRQLCDALFQCFVHIVGIGKKIGYILYRVIVIVDS